MARVPTREASVAQAVRPTGVEVFFDEADLIVSKTDLKGRLTYANRTFCQVAGYREDEVVGQPHSIIRHPDMPRAVFWLLWNAILEGREIFAYVKNMARSGDHYWVFAHVTPSRDASRAVCGFHSNRRVPKRAALQGTIEPLYAELLRIEAGHRNAKEGLAASIDHLQGLMRARGKTYDEFIFSL
jgi:PAS domain S-box-containing protein